MAAALTGCRIGLKGKIMYEKKRREERRTDKTRGEKRDEKIN